MSEIKVSGINIPNMPWQNKPADCSKPIWRYTQNPITDWNPTPKCARIFNSAAIPWNGRFAGVFRADHINGVPQLHVGFSDDAIHWKFEDEEIRFVDENGNAYQPNYAYDPRVVEIDGVVYVVWCTDFSGPVLGIARTTDFKTFVRMENITTPYNRNGVLFPRKINCNIISL